jgi:hypothetical protein
MANQPYLPGTEKERDILKDISTVNYEPQRLFEWARLAMEVVQNSTKD